MIVIFAEIAWEDLHQRPQHLATRFAKSERVLWVEPATLGHRFVHAPVEVRPNIFKTTIPMFPFNARNRRIRKTAYVASHVPGLRQLLGALQEMFLRDALRRILPVHDSVSFLVHNFQMMPLVKTASNAPVVYDYIDDAFGFSDVPAYVHRDWVDALGRASFLTATSPVLAARIREARDRDVILVPNGVEYERFATPVHHPRPADLPSPGRPVVGYVGSVYPWIDFDLLSDAAEKLAGMEFVIIGREHPDVLRQLNELRRFPNVRVLGMKPYAEIPAYLSHIDAGIIPFRTTRLTEGVNPVKLYEYSAAGVTTVATDFSPDTLAFADIVLIAHTRDEFADHLRTAIARRNNHEWVAALRAFARANDWEQRSASFSRLLAHTL
jgi:glycosyltransferase involved in cell wall biosynthesis